jgi:polar amino acid transport system substrate-binding protein
MLRHTLLLLCFWLGTSHANETITLDAEDDWAPFSYVKDGQLLGFTPSIIRAAFKTQGVDVKFNIVPFARCLREAETGVALGCFDIEINAENQNKYLWHETPLLLEGLSIYALAPHQRRDLTAADLDFQTVAVTHGYTYPPMIMNNSKIIRDLSPSDEVQFKKLAVGRVKYALVNTTPAQLILQKNPRYQGRIIEVGLVNKAKFYLGFSPHHKDGARMAQIFEQGMKAIKADGQYHKLEAEFRARLR